MTSSFNVQQASGYEQLMGRWSRKLADPFIEFVGLEDKERVLDVGCGTGSLTFALPRHADVTEIAAIDFSPVFVEDARKRNSDQRIDIKQGDATALPYPDGHFDRAMALLVLHFVPEASKAVAEMRRVVKKDGVVGAAVWDHLGGMPVMRMVLDTMAPIDEAAQRLRSHYCFQPMMRPGEMAATFRSAGLGEIEETSILIRMDYASFDDFWAPISSGEGPLGKYIASLDATTRGKADTLVRAAYESGQPDGPRSFVAVAWACRGRA
jgi:ubiquinone/menaquinone biosynthesis C-methylase UbiE